MQNDYQPGESIPMRAVMDLKVLTLRITNKRDDLAHPVSGDARDLMTRVALKLNASAGYGRKGLTSVATGTGPWK